MPSVPSKDMLQKLLTTGTLTAREREMFESMWDAVHRYGRLSPKQNGVIETAFYKLDAGRGKTVAPVRSGRRANYLSPSVKVPQKVRSLEAFKKLCPEADEAQLRKIMVFFKTGGEVIEVRPKDAVH